MLLQERGRAGVGQTHTNGSQFLSKTITVIEFDLYLSIFVLKSAKFKFLDFFILCKLKVNKWTLGF